ncbi:MAG: glycosyltransferase family 1 protein, partial [Candidatus Binatia bacterium]
MTDRKHSYHISHVLRRLVPSEWGGTETVVLTTCRYLQDRGVRSRILATAALSREGSDRIGGIPVQRFSYRYPLWGLPASQREQMDKKGGNPLSFSLFRYLLNHSDLGLVHLHTMGRLAA